jgi:3-oxoacyl-[acyl-carrier-protein] synthase-3
VKDISSGAVGIVEISSVLPERVIDNLERAEAFGFDEQFIREKVGFIKLRSSSTDASTIDLATQAVETLKSKTGLDLSKVDCLVVCTQNPDRHGLPNTASALHGDLGLSQSCAAFDISLGCSGYVYGLSVIKSFMDGNGLSCGILVTADPYSKIIGPEDRNTAILFGDGATATLMVKDGPWRVGKALFGSNGKLRSAIEVGKDGRLQMNGRQVFVFSSTVVPNLIRDVLGLNGVARDEVDRFIVHQGSKYIVDDLRRQVGVTEDAMPFVAKLTGNLVSSSIPVALEELLKQDISTILIAGFGVGLSWSANLLTRAAN